MNDIAILQELGLTLFTPRIDTQPPTPSLPIIALSEIKVEFSEAHQTQLTKIMSYLGYQQNEYSLIFAGELPPNKPLIAFGIDTHSISTMIQNPAVKREVLHAIQHLRRNS